MRFGHVLKLPIIDDLHLVIKHRFAMADYLYLDYEDQPLVDRFPATGTSGSSVWRRLIPFLVRLFEAGENDSFDAELRPIILRELQELFGAGPFESVPPRPTAELVLLLLQAQLRQEAAKTLLTARCPCLFISHRRSDSVYALRVAQVAASNGFDYWLDVLDPGLKLLAANPMIPQWLVPLLTACIIEMALINCTHVLACMTPGSRGSLWIPYEYGRITEIPGLFRRSCAWQHPQLAAADYPEYMFLGVTTRAETEIIAWLRSEYSIGLKSGGQQPGGRQPGCGGDPYRVQAPTELEKIDEAQQHEFDAWLDAGMPLKKDITVLPVFRFKPR